MPFGEDSVLGRRYRLISQVGRGGMGRVWHAHDDLLHRDVAVKEVIFPPGLSAADREVLYERTLREARSAARLSHPGIVTVHDVVEEDGRPWIVMEYVRAKSLQEVIDAEGRLPVERVADIGSQMLAALRKAHASGVLHRDVKPANVLLDTGGHGATRVVITDFGIARMEGDATLTQTGIVLGSPAYIAPERARGEPAGPASDLWALGATLYAACEGRSPHDRVEAMAALTAVLYEEPGPPRHAGPLAPLLMGLLVKDPARRVTADQAATDLARAARGEVPSPRPGATPDGAPSPGMTETGSHVPDPPASWTVDYGSGGSGGPPSEPDATLRGPSGPSGPMPGPAGGPGLTRGRRAFRGKVVIAVVVVVVLLAAVAVAAVLLTQHGARGASGGPSSTPPSASSTSSTPSPPTPDPAPTTVPTVPAGFHRAGGPRGSSIAVPSGWTRQVLSGDSVRWTQPSTGAHIQVDTIPWKVADPVEHWRQFESEVMAKANLPGFRETRLSGRFDPRGWPASDLEYTWSTRDHGTLRAYDRGFTAGGRQYAILVAAPSRQWSRYSDLPSTIFNSFQPG
jgi:serine/threonine protein kinase